MSGNNEVTTTVLKTPALTPAPVRHYWNLFATDGPADLYRGFAMDAVDAYLEPLGNIEEKQFNLLMDVVHVAVSTVLKAAHVSDSWLPQYEAATAHLVSTGEITRE